MDFELRERRIIAPPSQSLRCCFITPTFDENHVVAVYADSGDDNVWSVHWDPERARLYKRKMMHVDVDTMERLECGSTLCLRDGTAHVYNGALERWEHWPAGYRIPSARRLPPLVTIDVIEERVFDAPVVAILGDWRRVYLKANVGVVDADTQERILDIGACPVDLQDLIRTARTVDVSPIADTRVVLVFDPAIGGMYAIDAARGVCSPSLVRCDGWEKFVDTLDGATAAVTVWIGRRGFRLGLVVGEPTECANKPALWRYSTGGGGVEWDPDRARVKVGADGEFDALAGFSRVDASASSSSSWSPILPPWLFDDTEQRSLVVLSDAPPLGAWAFVHQSRPLRNVRHVTFHAHPLAFAAFCVEFEDGAGYLYTNVYSDEEFSWWAPPHERWHCFRARASLPIPPPVAWMPAGLRATSAHLTGDTGRHLLVVARDELDTVFVLLYARV